MLIVSIVCTLSEMNTSWWRSSGHPVVLMFSTQLILDSSIGCIPSLKHKWCWYWPHCLTPSGAYRQWDPLMVSSFNFTRTPHSSPTIKKMCCEHNYTECSEILSNHGLNFSSSQWQVTTSEQSRRGFFPLLISKKIWIRKICIHLVYCYSYPTGGIFSSDDLWVANFIILLSSSITKLKRKEERGSPVLSPLKMEGTFKNTINQDRESYRIDPKEI